MSIVSEHKFPQIEFSCPNCAKEFKREHNFTKHVEEKICEKEIYECKYCCDTFTTGTSMYRHIRKYCEEKKKIDRESNELKKKNNENMRLKNENQKLRAKINKIEKTKKPSHTTNNYTVNIDNSTKNVTNNYITIVAYGKEDLSRISHDEIVRALKTGFKSTKHLTEAVHFNPNYPEYSNIKRSNFNMKKKVAYHDGASWITTTDPHMIDKLYERKRDFIEEIFENYNDQLTQGDITRLKRWLDTDEDDHRIYTVKNELRELLFNKREIAEANEECLNKSVISEVDNLDIEDIDSEERVKIFIKKSSKRAVAPRNGKKRKAVARRSKN
jgi:hypothetical protein